MTSAYAQMLADLAETSTWTLQLTFDEAVTLRCAMASYAEKLADLAEGAATHGRENAGELASYSAQAAALAARPPQALRKPWTQP